MREATALEVAVGLLHLPSRARMLRAGDLPSDLEALLRIVAGDDRALADALRSANVSEQTILAAASFYIEQVLLHPDADCYRSLGVSPDATTDQLRRHMALLLRWLHPDREANVSRAVFVGRVTEAWNNLKTAERRAVYDAARGIGNGRSSDLTPGAGAANLVRNSAHAATSRHQRSETRAPRRRSASRGVWHFLRQLMGQVR